MEHLRGVAKLSTLLDAGHTLLPELNARMATAARLLRARRALAMEHNYRVAPLADFSQTILQDLHKCWPFPRVRTHVVRLGNATSGSANS